MNDFTTYDSPDDLYFRYKTSTELLLQYLYSTARKHGYHFVSDATMSNLEMVQAAKVINRQKIQPPNEVFWAIQSSITGRLEMSVLYQTQPELQNDLGSDTHRSHRHFINVLGKHRRILFPSTKKIQKQAVVKDSTAHDNIPELDQITQHLNIADDEGDGKNDTAEELDEQADEAVSINDVGEDCLEDIANGIDEQANEAQFGKKASFKSLRAYMHKLFAEVDKKGDPSGMSIEGDDLMWKPYAEQVYIQVIARNMHEKQALTSIWDEFKSGELSLFEAAYFTNHIYECKRSSIQIASRVLGFTDVTQFLNSMHTHHEARCAAETANHKEASNKFKLSTELQETLECVRSCRQFKDENKLPEAVNFIDPRKLVPPQWTQDVAESSPDGTKKTRKYVLMHLIADSMRPAGAEACMTVQHGFIYSHKFQSNDIEAFGSRTNDASYELSTVMGFSWSVDQYQRWLWGTGATSASSNPRVQVLRFAQELLTSIDATISEFGLYYDEGEGIVLSPRVLKSTRPVLNGILSNKRFDSYYQAPWVAGSQLVGLWLSSMTLGVTVCNEQGFVATVLHLFQAAAQTSVLQRNDLPALDLLCDILKGCVFKDAYPTLNFLSHFCTAIGGGFQNKVETDKRIRTLQSRAKQTGKSFALSIAAIRANQNRRVLPKHLPCIHPGCSEKGSFKPMIATDLSLACTIADVDAFQPGITQLSRMLGYGQSQAALKKTEDEVHEGRMEDYRTSANATGSATKKEIRLIREMITSEYTTGPLPVTRVNWFLVIQLCVQILAELGRSSLLNGAMSSPETGMTVAVELLMDMEEKARYGRKAQVDTKGFEVLVKALHRAFDGVDLRYKHL